MNEGKIQGEIGDSKLRQDAHELSDIEYVTSISESADGLKVQVHVPNMAWGLPDEVYEFMMETGLRIVDFSGMKTGLITIYLSRE